MKDLQYYVYSGISGSFNSVDPVGVTGPTANFGPIQYKKQSVYRQNQKPVGPIQYKPQVCGPTGPQGPMKTVPAGTIYPGVIPIRSEIKVLPADEPRASIGCVSTGYVSIGWVVKESIGIGGFPEDDGPYYDEDYYYDNGEDD